MVAWWHLWCKHCLLDVSRLSEQEAEQQRVEHVKEFPGHEAVLEEHEEDEWD